MPSKQPQFDVVTYSRPKQNQDQDAYLCDVHNGRVFLAAMDGVSSARRGHDAAAFVRDVLASQLPELWAKVDAGVQPDLVGLLRAWWSGSDGFPGLLKAYLEACAGDADLQTTMVAVLASPTDLAVMWVGDSRAYIMENGRLVRLTEDHAVRPNEQLEWGDMAHYAFDPAPLSRWMGAETSEDWCSFARRDIEPGQVFLCATDGIYHLVAPYHLERRFCLGAWYAWNLQQAIDIALSGLEPGIGDDATLVAACLGIPSPVRQLAKPLPCRHPLIGRVVKATVRNHWRYPNFAEGASEETVRASYLDAWRQYTGAPALGEVLANADGAASEAPRATERRTDAAVDPQPTEGEAVCPGLEIRLYHGIDGRSTRHAMASCPGGHEVTVPLAGLCELHVRHIVSDNSDENWSLSLTSENENSASVGIWRGVQRTVLSPEERVLIGRTPLARVELEDLCRLWAGDTGAVAADAPGGRVERDPWTSVRHLSLVAADVGAELVDNDSDNGLWVAVGDAIGGWTCAGPWEVRSDAVLITTSTAEFGVQFVAAGSAIRGA